MLRIACVLGVAGLLAVASDLSAKPKRVHVTAATDKIAVLFHKLDTNHDGKLTREEFKKLPDVKKHKKAVDPSKKATKAAKLDKKFDQLDTHHNGKLTLHEFRKITELKKQKKDKAKA